MACRCQERRAAIKRALMSKSVTTAKKELGFVARTAAEDLNRFVNIRGTRPSKRS